MSWEAQGAQGASGFPSQWIRQPELCSRLWGKSKGGGPVRPGANPGQWASYGG